MISTPEVLVGEYTTEAVLELGHYFSGVALIDDFD